jgi:hypothetical protein
MSKSIVKMNLRWRCTDAELSVSIDTFTFVIFTGEVKMSEYYHIEVECWTRLLFHGY